MTVPESSVRHCIPGTSHRLPRLITRSQRSRMLGTLCVPASGRSKTSRHGFCSRDVQGLVSISVTRKNWGISLHPRNGMVPPSKKTCIGLPKVATPSSCGHGWSRENLCIMSHGRHEGDFHGCLCGIRIDPRRGMLSFNEVCVLKTFPAFSTMAFRPHQ